MDKIMLILGGVSKVFVSEIVEKARSIANKRCDMGNLLPIHILQSYNSIVEKCPLISKLYCHIRYRKYHLKY